MRILAVILTICGLMSITAFGVEQPTFSEFKALSKEERRRVINTAAPDLRGRLLNLEQRIEIAEEIGTDAWRQLLEREAIVSRGFLNLLSVFILHKNLHGAYVMQEFRSEEGQEVKNAERLHAVERQNELATKVFEKAFRILVYLARTNETSKLEVEAQEAIDKISRLLPSKVRRVAEKDLREADKLAKELLKRIEVLPRLSETELDAELESLAERVSLPRRWR